MALSDWKEVHAIITSNGINKSAGWDGVTCDLVELLNGRCISLPGNPYLSSEYRPVSGENLKVLAEGYYLDDPQAQRRWVLDKHN